MFSLPEVPLLPDHAFDARQEVEFFANHESVKDLSSGHGAGVALSDIDGRDGAGLPVSSLHAPAIIERIRSPTRKRIPTRTIRLALPGKQPQFYEAVLSGPERKGTKQLP